jgi:hypothetical protein
MVPHTPPVLPRFWGQTAKPPARFSKRDSPPCLHLKQALRCRRVYSVMRSWPPASLSHSRSLGPPCHLHRHPLRLTLSTRRLHPPSMLCLTSTCSARITLDSAQPPWLSGTNHSAWPRSSRRRPSSCIHHLHTMRQANTYLQLQFQLVHNQYAQMKSQINSNHIKAHAKPKIIKPNKWQYQSLITRKPMHISTWFLNLPLDECIDNPQSTKILVWRN